MFFAKCFLPRYLQCENNKPNMDDAHEGEMIAGKPHLFFWDENFVNVFLHIVDFIWVDGKRRIKRESFDKWYGSQTKYTKVKEIEEVENYVD